MAQRAADQVTLTDLTDGVSVVLSKDSHIFQGTISAAQAGSTTVKVVGFLGSDIVAASVNVAAVTKPANVTVVSDNHATSPTLTISVTTAVTTSGEVVIPVVINGLTIEKRFSFSIAFVGATGVAGTPGVSATLTGIKNEAQAIVTTSAGLTVGASTIQVDFFGYVGAIRTAATAVVSGLPTGITVGTNTAGTGVADGILTFAVASGSNLGGGDSGAITVTITCNAIARASTFSWSKAKAGTNGTNGSDGSDSVTLEINSSQGLIFKNTQVATILTARVYKGGVEQIGAAITALGTIKWYKDGSGTALGTTGVSLTVTAGDVIDRSSYEAKLEY